MYNFTNTAKKRKESSTEACHDSWPNNCNTWHTSRFTAEVSNHSTSSARKAIPRYCLLHLIIPQVFLGTERCTERAASPHKTNCPIVHLFKINRPTAVTESTVHPHVQVCITWKQNYYGSVLFSIEHLHTVTVNFLKQFSAQFSSWKQYSEHKKQWLTTDSHSIQKLNTQFS